MRPWAATSATTLLESGLLFFHTQRTPQIHGAF
jgi:hypothetical protein